jgi:hypothetical protein
MSNDEPEQDDAERDAKYPPGLLLAVPLLMIVKAVSEHIEALHPIAALLKA